MVREPDHWFAFKGAKWRDGTRGLSPGAKGLYADVISLMHETADAGFADDAGKIAKELGYRDKRTVAAPLAELKTERKFVIWKGRLYNPTVCRDRHRLAVKRKQRSPVPAEVWPLIEAMEASTDPVDSDVDKGGGSPQATPELRGSPAEVPPKIENSGGQVVEFPRNRGSESETHQHHEVVVAVPFEAPRARGDPATVRA